MHPSEVPGPCPSGQISGLPVVSDPLLLLTLSYPRVHLSPIFRLVSVMIPQCHFLLILDLAFDFITIISSYAFSKKLPVYVF